MTALVWIVRHGETSANALKIIQGWQDVPLNEEGVAQARVAGRFLSSTTFDQVYASDLSRALKTAQVIAELQSSPKEVIVDARIRERALGTMEGKQWGDPTGDISTIEPAAVLTARLLSFWDSITTGATGVEANGVDEVRRNVLIVSHGGSIRQLVAAVKRERGIIIESDSPLLALEYEKNASGLCTKRVGNCSITQILVNADGKGGKLQSYADDDHFIGTSRIPSPTENVDVIVE